MNCKELWRALKRYGCAGAEGADYDGDVNALNNFFASDANLGLV